MAFSFGSTYGTTTLKYFQDHRNAALESSHTPFSKGGHFPTVFSPNPNLALRDRGRHFWLLAPSYTRFNLDSDRSTELSRFYQVGWEGHLSPQSAFVCHHRALSQQAPPGGLARGRGGSGLCFSDLPSPRGSGDS